MVVTTRCTLVVTTSSEGEPNLRAWHPRLGKDEPCPTRTAWLGPKLRIALLMASWREHASPAAQQQLDELLNVALGFAQSELAARGEFYPYAAVIRNTAEPELIAAHPGIDAETPLAADVLHACIATLRD